jgi:hypothetical protein
MWSQWLQFKHEPATWQNKAEMACGRRSGDSGGAVCRHDRQHPSGAADREPCNRPAADTCFASATQRGGEDCGDYQYPCQRGDDRHHPVTSAIKPGTTAVDAAQVIGAKLRRVFLPSLPVKPRP